MSKRTTLTTEQMMDAAIKTVKQMSPEEKARLRRQLKHRPLVESHILEHWLGFPRLQNDWCRIVSPEGSIEDVPEENLDAAIEGNAEFHRVFRPEEWQEFIKDVLRELAVRELPVSSTVN